ncbi:MAG: hypothetical protein ACKVQW_13730 [Pyrinomonadaceae bacterium]
MKVIHIVILCLLFVAAAHAQGDVPAAPSVEDAYLAKDDGSGKAGEKVDEFTPTDIPIYCVVLLDTQRAVTVKINFVAVSVAGVKAETKVVTASYTTKEGQNRVNFTGRPEGLWTPGKYRVDIFLDGKAAKAVEFEIKGKSVVAGTRSFAQPKPRTAKRGKPQK